MQIQGNQFTLSNEQKEILNQLKRLMNLAKAILAGSNEEYEILLSGSPFGANNFLNKAFNEKGLGIELSQISSNGSMHGSTIIDKYLGMINGILENDKNNKEMLPKQEKMLEAKLYRDTRVRINSFLSTLKSGNEDQRELFELLSVAFSAIGSNIEQFMNESIGNVSMDTDLQQLENLLISFRNGCLSFEEAFHSVSENIADNGNEKYKEFVSIIAHSIVDSGKIELWQDPATLDTVFLKTDTDQPIFCDDSTFYQYLLQCTYGNSKEALSAIKERLSKGTTFFPFGSQLDIATQAIQFLCRSNPELNGIWMDIMKSLSSKSEIKNSYPILKRAIKIVCSGGTGKSEVMINLIVDAIQHMGNSSYDKTKIWFIANTERQLKNMLDGIEGDFNEQKMLTKELLTKGEDFFEEHRDSVFIIDEASILSSEELVKLDELCDKYNINYVLAGDTKQLGAPLNFENVLCASTKQLNESKRASDNINRDNLKNLETIFDVDKNGRRFINFGKLKPFRYYDNGQLFSGIKFVDSDFNEKGERIAHNFSEAEVLQFLKEHNIPKDSKILILSNNISTISNPELKEYVNLDIENDVEKIQGISWDYVFNDLDLTIECSKINGLQCYASGDEEQKVYEDGRRIYTIMSRHRKGFISYKPIILKDTSTNEVKYSAQAQWNNEQSQFDPVPSGLLGNKEILDDYIEFEKRVFNGLNLPESVKLKPAKSEAEEAIDPELTNPINHTELVPVKTVPQNPENRLQVSSAFVPKHDFENGILKAFNLTRDEYSHFRAIVYGWLTGTIDDPKEKLKAISSGLENGHFYLKIAEYAANELFDLASYGKTKSTETLQTRRKHLYIVYRLDNGNEINLGQVKGNIEIKKIKNANPMAGVEIPRNIDSINDLIDKNSAGTYFEFDDFVKSGNVSRSQNLLDYRQIEHNGVKYRVWFDHGGLHVESSRVEHGKVV